MDALMQGWFSGPLGVVLVRLLNMSAAGGVLICVVILLRAALYRAPKWTRGILWAIVAVQLVCPLSLRSPLSVYRLLPRSDEVRSEQVEVFRLGGGSEKPILILEAPQIAGYAPAAPTSTPVPTGSPASGTLPIPAAAVPAPAPQVQGSPSVYLPTAGTVWLAGFVLMLLYALVSALTLRRRVRASIPLYDPRFRLCDSIDTPFILGIFRPRVYLPSGLNTSQRTAVFAHETAHLRRRDHWWKPLGWLLLAVHWFNPLVWLAYIMLCRDIELACDEKAIRVMDSSGRADYSQALLDCAAPRALLRACPLAFGEVGIKERIRAVLNYKKPAFWIVILAVIACFVVAVCFLTRPGPIKVQTLPPGAVTPTPYPTASITPVPTADLIPELRSGTYEGECFSIRINAEEGIFTYNEADYSSHISTGLYALEGDVLTLSDVWPNVSGEPSIRRNRFRVADGSLVWLEEDSDNFVFVTLTDGATFRLKDAEAPLRRLTMDDVRILAAKGDALTWEDLAPFAGEDIGSGRYVYLFPIDEQYLLSVSDGKRTGTPQQVMLVRKDYDGVYRSGPGFSIDIRTNDIEEFLSRPKGPFLTVTSGGQSAAAVPHMLYERSWVDDLHNWLYGDGFPIQTLLEHPELIPTLTLADDFLLSFGGGAVRKSSMEVYDEQLVLLKDNYYGDTVLNWLEPGTYYCAVEVHGPLGRYIAEADANEETAFLCVFRLVVPEHDRPAPYTPEETHDLVKAELHVSGDVHTLTDAGALAQLEYWLSNASVLPGGAACPFSSVLTLTRTDGAVFSLCPAEDSCGAVFADGSYYRYASDNAEFWALFGITLQ